MAPQLPLHIPICPICFNNLHQKWLLMFMPGEPMLDGRGAGYKCANCHAEYNIGIGGDIDTIRVKKEEHEQ